MMWGHLPHARTIRAASATTATLMSADEVIVTIGSAVVGPLMWTIWLVQMSRLRVASRRRSGAGILALALAASAAAIFYVLTTAASFDVVDSPQYQFMYVVLGLAWLRIASDRVSRSPASARATTSSSGGTSRPRLPRAARWLGVAFCYAGGEHRRRPGMVGRGVRGGARDGHAVRRLGWRSGDDERSPTPSTIDRDLAAGVRLGAFLAACGLVLGRGVAGDWYSAAETVADLLRALPRGPRDAWRSP